MHTKKKHPFHPSVCWLACAYAKELKQRNQRDNRNGNRQMQTKSQMTLIFIYIKFKRLWKLVNTNIFGLKNQCYCVLVLEMCSALGVRFSLVSQCNVIDIRQNSESQDDLQIRICNDSVAIGVFVASSASRTCICSPFAV